MSKGVKRTRDVDPMSHFKNKNKQNQNLNEMLSSLKSQVFNQNGSSIQHYDSFEDVDHEEEKRISTNFIKDPELISLIYEASLLDVNIVQMQKQRQQLEQEKKRLQQQQAKQMKVESAAVVVVDVCDEDSDATIEWCSDDDDVLLSTLNDIDGLS